MIALTFFSWWYTQGWKNIAVSLRPRLRKTSSQFSVKVLIRTLFSPWRRIISYPRAGLSEHIQAAIDNLVSRAIGFFVRIFVLLAALLIFLMVIIMYVLEILLWPLLPIAIPVFVILGIT